jgi:hypothetical protein
LDSIKHSFRLFYVALKERLDGFEGFLRCMQPD